MNSKNTIRSDTMLLCEWSKGDNYAQKGVRKITVKGEEERVLQRCMQLSSQKELNVAWL